MKNLQIIPKKSEKKSRQGTYIESDLQYITMSKRLLSSAYKELLKVNKKKMKRQMQSSKRSANAQESLKDILL